MRKASLVVIVLVITSIAIIFSTNTYPYTQAENMSLNKNVYNFLTDQGNRKDTYGAAIKLNQGSSQNTCVYFMSEVLRRNNIDVAKETSNTKQFISVLKEKRFKKQNDYENLKPGDICFTTDDETGFPSHTFVFMKWVKEGNYDYAYICDNQAKDYEGKVYHIRNINVISKSNGAAKDAFAFFMRKS